MRNFLYRQQRAESTTSVVSKDDLLSSKKVAVLVTISIISSIIAIISRISF